MSFTGECLGVDWANPDTGPEPADFGGAIRYLYRDGDATAFAGGDACIVGIYPSPLLLEPGDDAVLSWVLELGAGTAGTIRVSCGLDPTWNLDDPGYAGEALGEHAVDGASTLVLTPITSITPADLLAGDAEPVLFLEVLSGTVHVRQVRMRVWPPTGPQGAWAPGTAFPIETSSGIQVRRSDVVTGDSLNEASLSAATAAALAEYNSKTGTPVTWSDFVNPGDQFQVLAKVADDLAPGPTIVWGANFATALVHAKFRPAPADTTTSGTPGIHPDMVPGDYGNQVSALTGGPVYPELLAWNMGVSIPTEMGVGTPSAPVEFVVGVSNTALDIVGGVGPYLAPTSFTGATSGAVFTFPPYADVLLTVQTGMWGDDPAGEYEESGFISPSGDTVSALVPDHLWWNPDLPWVQPKTPRFFVKDLEGDLVPVGFGKPNSETRILRIPTAMGRWRDLTGVEYDAYTVGEPAVRGRYPLKIKRDDGTMDVVGLFVPEE